jgi:hypothetical protein
VREEMGEDGGVLVWWEVGKYARATVASRIKRGLIANLERVIYHGPYL